MSRITGRADDMIKVKGVAIFPSQIEKALLKVGDVEPHYLIIVTRPGTLYKIEVKVEACRFFPQEIIIWNLFISHTFNIKCTQMSKIKRYERKNKRVINKRNLH